MFCLFLIKKKTIPATKSKIANVSHIHGIDIDDCSELSGKLEDILDERDLIPTSYMLEVSSPGLDRELKKERDFQREMGKSIDVSLFAPLDGEKVITGELKGYDGSSVSVGDKVIPMEKVAKVNLHIDF